MTGPPIICDPNPESTAVLRGALGGAGRVFSDLEALREYLGTPFSEDTIVLGPTVSESEAFAISDYMRVHRPSLGVILVRSEVTTPLLQDALRTGVREVVDLRDTRGLQHAVQRNSHLAATLREQITPVPQPPSAPAERGVITTVFSAKGGCGKTTLSTNLAAALADHGRRQVCLVDLDLAFGDVAITLQLFPAHTIADAVPIAQALDGSALQSILTQHSPGLAALVAPVDPGSGESVPASLVGRILELLSEQFDFVVVDTPPSFDDHVLAAFDVSDVIALIATLDVPALKNLKLTLETLDLLKYPREKWRVVLNRADSKVGLSVGEVENTLKTEIALHIPSSRDVPASINRGVPIMLDDAKHPVSQVIRGFAEHHVVPVLTRSVVNGRAAPFADPRERRGLLRKRRSRT